jgi:hypothetical protein
MSEKAELDLEVLKRELCATYDEVGRARDELKALQGSIRRSTARASSAFNSAGKARETAADIDALCRANGEEIMSILEMLRRSTHR